MNKLYVVTPLDSEFFLYLTNRYADAETFLLEYKGIFSPLKIREYFLREATEEELEQHDDRIARPRNESGGEA